MQSNAVILCVRNYLDKRVKEIYGFQNVLEMFVEMGIIEELPHFIFHVFEVVVQIAESDPFTQLFGFVIEGTQHQEILDYFIEVAHDVIPKIMKMEKLLESIEQEYEEEYEEEGEAWLFGNYNQGHRDFKEEREHEMAKSSRKFKKASSERIAKKYASAHQKLKKNLKIKKNLVKKVSKRSGKKHVIERV